MGSDSMDCGAGTGCQYRSGVIRMRVAVEKNEDWKENHVKRNPEKGERFTTGSQQIFRRAVKTYAGNHAECDVQYRVWRERHTFLRDIFDYQWSKISHILLYVGERVGESRCGSAQYGLFPPRSCPLL